jgi:hypothetical protein
MRQPPVRLGEAGEGALEGEVEGDAAAGVVEDAPGGGTGG